MMGNGQTEMMNRIIIGLLIGLMIKKKAKLPLYINDLVHSYNTIVYSSTGYSSFYLMFAREDIIPASYTCYSEWVIDRGRAWVETIYKVRKDMETAWKNEVKIGIVNV